MKLLDVIISKAIYLLVIGMFLYLASTTLAIAHLDGFVYCSICNQVETVSPQHHIAATN